MEKAGEARPKVVVEVGVGALDVVERGHDGYITLPRNYALWFYPGVTIGNAIGRTLSPGIKQNPQKSFGSNPKAEL